MTKSMRVALAGAVLAAGALAAAGCAPAEQYNDCPESVALDEAASFGMRYDRADAWGATAYDIAVGGCRAANVDDVREGWLDSLQYRIASADGEDLGSIAYASTLFRSEFRLRDSDGAAYALVNRSGLFNTEYAALAEDGSLAARLEVADSSFWGYSTYRVTDGAGSELATITQDGGGYTVTMSGEDADPLVIIGLVAFKQRLDEEAAAAASAAATSASAAVAASAAY